MIEFLIALEMQASLNNFRLVTKEIIYYSGFSMNPSETVELLDNLEAEYE